MYKIGQKFRIIDKYDKPFINCDYFIIKRKIKNFAEYIFYHYDKYDKYISEDLAYEDFITVKCTQINNYFQYKNYV